jgi:tRNA G46 methylase TrmB
MEIAHYGAAGRRGRVRLGFCLPHPDRRRQHAAPEPRLPHASGFPHSILQTHSVRVHFGKGYPITLYEFGAGTGHNLLELSKIFPDKNIYGSDFVKTAVDLLKLIAKRNKINLKAFQFDMSDPNKNIKILKNSGIYTSGALEQLSGNIYNLSTISYHKNLK